MKNYFEKMGLEKFRNNSTFLFLLCDAWILGFTYKKFTSKEMMDTLIKVAAARQGAAVNKEFIEQLYQLLTQSLILMLVLVAIVHIINYVLYNKNKKAAFSYLKLYSWTGSVSCFLWGVSILTTKFIPGLVFIGVGGCLAFNAIGLRYFPHQIVTKKNKAPRS